MRRPNWATAAVLAGVFACEEATRSRTAVGNLSLHTLTSATGVAALDAGRVFVRGPTNKTVDVTPGTTVTIDSLSPGTYTVALQGLIAGEVARFGQTTGIQVVAGRNTMATVSFPSFVPAVSSLMSAPNSKTFTVSYGSVAGAASYQVEYATNAAFTTNRGIRAAGAAETSVSITVPDYGTYFVRVRAIDPYEGTGQPSAAQTIEVKALADLVITSATLTATPASVAPGGAVQLSTFSVLNQGAAPSSAFRIGYYLSTDATITASDVLLGTQSPGVIQPGTSLNFTPPSLTIPTSTAAGSYFIGPLVDDRSEVAESNETNNFKTTALTVLAADQVNDPESSNGFACAPGFSQYQSFTPTRSSLAAVQLRFLVGSAIPAAGTSTSIIIRSGSPTGTSLGTDTAFVTGPQSAGAQLLVLFQFPSPITVTPGITYVIEWPITSATALSWVGTATNPYSRGTRFDCNRTALTNSDLNFRTY